MVKLEEKPFYLNREDCEWVKQTLASLTIEEKVGQLFCDILWDRPGASPLKLTETIQLGGVMYRPFSGRRMLETTELLQDAAKVPMLIACNLERGGSGGNGGLTDGTYISSPMGVAATDDPKMEYALGLVAAREGAACGINWTFEPIVDIDRNPENPITNVRTFGSDPDRIIEMSKAYIDACRENNIAVTIKHFPGDGVDYRDQHLMSSVNSLSAEEWFATYGRIYRELIDYGTQTVMTSHIRQPAVTRLINPGVRDEDILPGSLSRELNIEVLRNRFGFNGVIVTDATQMVGFTCSMPRRLAVPAAIANGADVFLFTIDQKEDFDYMMDGVKNGMITLERLNEAVTRILALKASLGLHHRKKLSDKKLEQTLRCQEHRKIGAEIADKNITLVKDLDGILPMTPEKYRRVKLIQCTNEQIPQGEYLPELKYFKQKLEQEGFCVQYFRESSYPGNGISLKEYQEETDLLIYFANMKVGSNQTTIRLVWDDFLGEESPKYVKDIPTLFLSFSNPYHLVDVPMVRTYINAYACNEFAVDAMIEKLLGRSEFKGKSPVDPFAGLWDTGL